MAKNIKRYDLLISCPGDIKSELDIIQKCIEDFNEKFSDISGIMLQTKHWIKSSYAQSGGKPQDLLNEQFIKDCDAAVAILWTRFGTPTDKYESGTEEEIEIMLQSGKQVFMYFCDKPLSPSKVKDEQYQKVQHFKDKYKNQGLYFEYSNDKEFEKMFFAHLTKFFMVNKTEDEKLNKIAPKLVLRGIDKLGNIRNQAHILKFVLNSDFNTLDGMKKIKTICSQINEIKLNKTLSGKSNMFLRKPVNIDDNIKKYITVVTEALNIELDNGFFELGDLSQDSLEINLYGGKNLLGSEEEKKKYYLILELYELFNKVYDWMKIENAFKDFSCIKFAVENEGTAIDEDIEITIILEDTEFMAINEEMIIEEDIAKFLFEKCDLEELLKINGTSEYLSYSETIRRVIGTPNYVPPMPLSFMNGVEKKNYIEEFKKDFQNALGYKVFKKANQLHIKLEIDYLKHNSIAAFPAPVFVKSIPKNIKYVITSKYMSNKIDKVIDVNSSSID